VLVVKAHTKEKVSINLTVTPQLSELMVNLRTETTGIQINALSMGTLEALLQYFQKEYKLLIPIGAIGISKVYKQDVTKIFIMNKMKNSGFALS
jgi:translation initiation factor IF-2